MQNHSPKECMHASIKRWRHTIRHRLKKEVDYVKFCFQKKNNGPRLRKNVVLSLKVDLSFGKNMADPKVQSTGKSNIENESRGSRNWFAPQPDVRGMSLYDITGSDV